MMGRARRETIAILKVKREEGGSGQRDGSGAGR